MGRCRWHRTCSFKDWDADIRFEVNLERARKEGSLIGVGVIPATEVMEDTSLEPRDMTGHSPMSLCVF